MSDSLRVNSYRGRSSPLAQAASIPEGNDGDEDVPVEPLDGQVSPTSDIPFPSAIDASHEPERSSHHGRLNSITQALFPLRPRTSSDKHDRVPSINLTTSRRPSTASEPIQSSRLPNDPNLSPDPNRVLSVESDPSVGGTKRVSFDHSDAQRASLSLPNVRNIFHVGKQPASDPSLPIHGDPNQTGANTSRNANSSPGRSRSPLRGFSFWPLHSHRSRESHEPFIPIDPYHFTIRTKPILDQCFRQVYRHLLFRLPSIYFNRVGRVFEDAEVSRAEVQRMIEISGGGGGAMAALLRERDWNPSNVPPSLSRFKSSWEEFVDTLIKEWKTLNIVSALLLSAILTIFQIPGTDEVVTRTTALLSLICALMSLIYGCVYILRFQTMRTMRKASRWAEAAQVSTTSIFWNVWVFLALPAISLSYSLLFFITSVLAFVWTTGTTTPPNPVNNKQAVGPRVVISAVFLLGVIYFGFVVRTFQSYSEPKLVIKSTSASANGNATGANNLRDEVFAMRRIIGDEERGFASARNSEEIMNGNGNAVVGGTSPKMEKDKELASERGRSNSRG